MSFSSLEATSCAVEPLADAAPPPPPRPEGIIPYDANSNRNSDCFDNGDRTVTSTNNRDERNIEKMPDFKGQVAHRVNPLHPSLDSTSLVSCIYLSDGFIPRSDDNDHVKHGDFNVDGADLVKPSDPLTVQAYPLGCNYYFSPENLEYMPYHVPARPMARVVYLPNGDRHHDPPGDEPNFSSVQRSRNVSSEVSSQASLTARRRRNGRNPLDERSPSLDQSPIRNTAPTTSTRRRWWHFRRFLQWTRRDDFRSIQDCLLMMQQENKAEFSRIKEENKAEFSRIRLFLESTLIGPSPLSQHQSRVASIPVPAESLSPHLTTAGGTITGSADSGTIPSNENPSGETCNMTSNCVPRPNEGSDHPSVDTQVETGGCSNDTDLDESGTVHLEASVTVQGVPSSHGDTLDQSPLEGDGRNSLGANENGSAQQTQEPDSPGSVRDNQQFGCQDAENAAVEIANNLDLSLLSIMTFSNVHMSMASTTLSLTGTTATDVAKITNRMPSSLVGTTATVAPGIVLYVHKGMATDRTYKDLFRKTHVRFAGASSSDQSKIHKVLINKICNEMGGTFLTDELHPMPYREMEQSVWDFLEQKCYTDFNRDTDVLAGRRGGAQNYRYVGHQRYLQACLDHSVHYEDKATCDLIKDNIAEYIVKTAKLTGRFLTKEVQGGVAVYYIMDHKSALEKTKQGLRDARPSAVLEGRPTGQLSEDGAVAGLINSASRAPTLEELARELSPPSKSNCDGLSCEGTTSGFDEEESSSLTESSDSVDDEEWNMVAVRQHTQEGTWTEEYFSSHGYDQSAESASVEETNSVELSLLNEIPADSDGHRSTLDTTCIIQSTVASRNSATGEECDSSIQDYVHNNGERADKEELSQDDTYKFPVVSDDRWSSACTESLHVLHIEIIFPTSSNTKGKNFVEELVEFACDEHSTLESSDCIAPVSREPCIHGVEGNNVLHFPSTKPDFCSAPDVDDEDIAKSDVAGDRLDWPTLTHGSFRTDSGAINLEMHFDQPSHDAQPRPASTARFNSAFGNSSAQHVVEGAREITNSSSGDTSRRQDLFGRCSSCGSDVSVPQFPALGRNRLGIVQLAVFDYHRSEMITFGTGFVVNKELGLIVTCAHLPYDITTGRSRVTRPPHTLLVGMLSEEGSEGAVFRFVAHPVLDKDVCRVDACVLKIANRLHCDVQTQEDASKISLPGHPISRADLRQLQSLELSKSSEVGDHIQIVGFNQSTECSHLSEDSLCRCMDLVRGHIARKFATSDARRLIAVVGCRSIKGHSGGPVFDSQLRVIGILSCGDSDEVINPNLYRDYVVPVEEFLPMLKRMCDRYAVPMPIVFE